MPSLSLKTHILRALVVISVVLWEIVVYSQLSECITNKVLPKLGLHYRI